jgi:integrase
VVKRKTDRRPQRWPGTRFVKDRNGEPKYCYVRPIDGGSEIRIAATFGSPDWEREYLAARGGTRPALRKLPRQAGLFARMTMAEAIERYRRSTTFASYAVATRERRDLHCRRLLEACPDSVLGEMTQDDVLNLFAGMTPKNHIAHVHSVRALFRFINERAAGNNQPKLHDPTLGYPWPKPVQSKGFRDWSDDIIDRFRDCWPLGTLERTMMELAYGTAQRKSDLINMKWSDIVDVIGEDGETYCAIVVPAQRKTKAAALCPIGPELQEALDAWKHTIQQRQVEMLTSRAGWMRKESEIRRARLGAAQQRKDERRRAEANYMLVGPKHLIRLHEARYSTVMRDALRAMGAATYQPGMDSFENVFSGHGLRKAAMRSIAEAGGSVFAIMAISGHTTTKHVMHYVQDMERQKLAVQAHKLREKRVEKRKAAQAKETDAAANIIRLERNKPKSV